MKIGIAEAIQRTVEHREIFHDEMLHVMRQIMRGELTPAQIAGFIIGLRVKKETVGEIAAAAQVMREFATPVPLKDHQHVVDVVGTGGDGAHTFNISTAATFVSAAAGAKVAKHGNRSVSSRSGSADVLEALGAKLDLTPGQIARAVEMLKVCAPSPPVPTTSTTWWWSLSGTSVANSRITCAAAAIRCCTSAAPAASTVSSSVTSLTPCKS